MALSSCTCGLYRQVVLVQTLRCNCIGLVVPGPDYHGLCRQVVLACLQVVFKTDFTDTVVNGTL